MIEELNPEVVTAELVKVERQSGIAENEALALRGQFSGHYQKIVELRTSATTITNPEDATHQKLAREVRLGLKNIRCDVERTRKQLKEDSLKRGKAIDGIANFVKYLCEPVEEKLMEIEQHAERKEAARIAALVAERSALLTEAGADPLAYNLGIMDESTFGIILDTAKRQKQEREEAARKAEADRIAREKAEAEEKAKIRAENERLRKEAEEREAAARAERERMRKEAEAKEAAARKQREAAEAQLRAEREARQKAEREAAEAKRKEEQRIAAEKAAAEAKAKAEREAAEKAARAPDKEKLVEFGKTLRALQYPEVAAPQAKSALRIFQSELGAALTRFAEQVGKL